MLEERASHSPTGNSKDLDATGPTGNEDTDLQRSHSCAIEDELAGDAAKLNDDGQCGSSQEAKPSDVHSKSAAEPLPGVQKTDPAQATNNKKRKNQKRTEKPHRTEKLRDYLPKKLLADEPNSKTRREYKNYEEMLACLNLLKYMEWDKIDPKTHKNSPCTLGLTRHEPADDRHVLLVHGLRGVLPSRLQVEDHVRAAADPSRQASKSDDDHRAALPTAC